MIIDKHGRERERYKIPFGASISAADGTEVKGVWDYGTFMGKEDEVLAEEKIQKANTEIIENVADQITRKEALEMKVWAVVIGVASYTHTNLGQQVIGCSGYLWI